MNGPTVTKDGRPIHYPVNELTALLGSTAGRGGVSASPPPAVKSGAWGSQTMTDAELKELNERYNALSKEPEAQLIKDDKPGVPQVFSLQQKKPTVSYRPNFNNVSRIDLERNVIVVDGLEFPLSQEDVNSLRLMCVNCVLNAVVNGLSGMLSSSGIDKRTLVDALKGGVISGQVISGGEKADEVPEESGVQGEREGPESSMEQGEQE